MPRSEKYKILVLFFVCIFWPVFPGCAQIKEAAKGFAGVSIREVEEARKEAIVKRIDYGYPEAFEMMRKILKERGSYIYRQSPQEHAIFLYVSEADTTPVGIFFKEIDSTHTQIEIASPSMYAKEFIAARISRGLSKEGQADVQQ
jgi:hypothetical protein